MANFEWYRSFVSIYREGSISAAARARHMTQPALTQHLAGLEAELGEALFLRTARRMIPTERGQALYSQVAQAIDRLERTSEQMKGSRRKIVLRLGSPVEYFHEQVITKLKDMSSHLLVSFGLAEQLLEELRENHLDMVISTQKIKLTGIQYVRLGKENFILIGSEPLPSSNQSEIKHMLESSSWISYDTDLPIIRRFWQEAFGEKPSFSPSFVIPDLRTIKEAVKSGLGISVLPDYLVKREIEAKNITELWRAPQPVTNSIWLAFRAVDYDDTLIQAFIARCLESRS